MKGREKENKKMMMRKIIIITIMIIYLACFGITPVVLKAYSYFCIPGCAWETMVTKSNPENLHEGTCPLYYPQLQKRIIIFMQKTLDREEN